MQGMTDAILQPRLASESVLRIPDTDHGARNKGKRCSCQLMNQWAKRIEAPNSGQRKFCTVHVQDALEENTSMIDGVQVLLCQVDVTDCSWVHVLKVRGLTNKVLEQSERRAWNSDPILLLALVRGHVATEAVAQLVHEGGTRHDGTSEVQGSEELGRGWSDVGEGRPCADAATPQRPVTARTEVCA